MSAAAERNVRRRLRGKTPPPLALLPEAQRFQGVAADAAAQGPGGYYAILGITRTATAEEVRHAYRKKALKVHPDKLLATLGRPPTREEARRAEAAYIQVVSAFDVLSDDTLRRQYDSQHFPPEHSDFSVEAQRWFTQADSQSAAHDRQQQAQREARLIMQDLLLERCDVAFAELGTSVLVALRNFLSGSRPACGEEERKRCSRKKLDPHLLFRPYGYEVTVRWASLMVSTSSTWSLERALAWRSALTLLQNRAKTRLREFEAQNPEGRPLPALVLKEEISDVLRMEPDLRLSFRCEVPNHTIRLWTPTTANWRLTLSHKSSFTKAVRKGREADISHAQLEARNAVEHDKQKSKQHCAGILTGVLAELDRRLLEDEQRRQAAEHQAAMMRSRLQFAEQKAAAAAELQAVLGLDAAEVAASLTKLRQLPLHLLRRRARALFAPARALPAPPAEPPRSPAAPSGSPAAPSGSPAAVPRVPARPPRPPVGRWRSAAAADFLPSDVVIRVLRCLHCVDIDCFRATARSAHDAGDQAYWDRCRVFSCPSDAIGGARFSSKGRRLAPKAAGPTALTVAYLAQPRLATYFEHLKIKTSGSELIKNDRLLTAISNMPHLRGIELPTSGWDDSCTRKRFLVSLQKRGIHVSLAS